MNKEEIIISKIENSYNVSVNLYNDGTSMFADFGENVSASVAQDLGGKKIFELISENGAAFSCEAEKLENGDIIDDSLVFNNNGITVSIICSTTYNN